ncbi:MAG: DUF58 domain-containing protein [Chloroflexota bacterium]|nr:DUF58 domain-containing protein [Chloroflexota bacterium]
MPNLLIFILLITFVALLFRIEFFFYLLYFFFGMYILSRLWGQHALDNVIFERECDMRAFIGDRLPVKIRIQNRGFLPLPWLRVHDSLPLGIKSPNFYHCVISLLPFEKKVLEYELNCRRRGYYPLGPLIVRGGDLFGLRNSEKRLEAPDALWVYPKIVPLSKLELEAKVPFGYVRTKERIFEDPSRLVGVRDYQSGDSTRHIHWKATAATGTLQVKRFEPAISIESQIFLNLNRDEYTYTRATPASETAIVTAASIASYLIEKRQTVGLSCNGKDPLAEEAIKITVPPRKGEAHRMHILDVLARAELSEHLSFADLLHQDRLQLTWGSTAIIISGHADDALFDNMLLMKRSGFHVMLILVDSQTPFALVKQRAEDVGVTAHQVWQERDLDVWR